MPIYGVSASLLQKTLKRAKVNAQLCGRVGILHSFLGSIAELLPGLTVLVIGGELLVRGASRLAAAVRISSLVIGLTVVAFGTSAPELAVSVQAADYVPQPSLRYKECDG